MKTLCYLTAEQYYKYHGDLMGCVEDKTHPGQVKVYDNWVNRIVLNMPVILPQVSQKDWATYSASADRLRSFQKHDIAKMAMQPYSLNRNKMGAGKTIEFIATCQLMGAKSILIVCPKPTIPQWVAQLKEWWSYRKDDVIRWSSKSKTPPKVGSIVVVNYEQLIKESTLNKFRNFMWDMVGIDEAHSIKNRNAKRTVAIKSIPTRFKNAMTGTPVLRSPEDLFSIFQWLNPEICGASYWRFTEYFCNVVEDFYGRHTEGLTTNVAHVEVLKKILDKLSVYNEIQVAQGKKKVTVPIEMDAKQKSMYNKIRKVLLDDLPVSVTIPNGAVKVTRLLQATSCPRVLDEASTWGGKFQWILQTLQVDSTMKIVVYSKFAEVVEQLDYFLKENGVGCVKYTGKYSQESNERSKNNFIQNSDIKVLAGTIGSLGTGIDGLQHVCNVCVFIDCDTRPTINAQCEDRLNRSGQQKEVLCYYLECEKSIDSRVAKVNLSRTEDLRKLLEE